MDVESYQGGGGGLFEKPIREHRRHRHRHGRLRRQQAWRRTLVGISIVAAALVVGGLGIGAALYFTQPPPTETPPPALGEEPKAVTGDPRLVGRWLTDLDSTIEQIREKTPLTDEQELQVRRQRQISVLTFTDKTLTIQIKGKPDTQEYNVTSTHGDQLVLKTYFVSSKSQEEIRIRFVGPDVCWVEVPKFKLVECYRRIKPPGPVADPSAALPDPLKDAPDPPKKEE